MREEIRRLLVQLEADGAAPERILEIGTARGGTLFLLATVAADEARIVSIDLPRGPFGGGYGRTRARLYRAFARAGQRIELLRVDSHDASVPARVLRLLDELPLDLLLADGDHTYEGVVRDLGLFSPLVRAGGLVVLHDIVPGEEQFVGGAPRVWQAIRDLNEAIEIVEDWKQGGIGLGIVRKQSAFGEAIALSGLGAASARESVGR